MLVTLPDDAGPGLWPTPLAVGVYPAGPRFEDELRRFGVLVTDHPFEPWWDSSFTGDRLAALLAHQRNDGPHDYGVCDRWEQVPARWPQLLTDPRAFVLTVGTVRKADQPPHDGWRWHKWGTYIGFQDPQCEYLVDEPDIDEVVLFSVFEVRGGTPAAR